MSTYPGAGRHSVAQQPQDRSVRRTGRGRGGYDETRHGHVPQGRNPYGEDPYGQDPHAQDVYGQDAHGQAVYGQDAYGQQYGQQYPGTRYGAYHGQSPMAQEEPPRPMLRRRGVRVSLLAAGAAAAVLVGVTACSATQSATPIAETSALPGDTPAQQAGAPALTGPNLKVSQVPAGTVVTNDGFTVYRFEKDTSKPAKSNCNGNCAQQWPPVLATDTPWLKGVPTEKVGTVTRDDGTKQLTLGGWPLYRFAKDGAPGETKGQGVGGTWCAVGPDGKPAKISGAPAAAPTGGSSGGSAYGSSGSGGGSYGSAPASQAPAPAASGGDSGYSSGGY